MKKAEWCTKQRWSEQWDESVDPEPWTTPFLFYYWFRLLQDRGLFLLKESFFPYHCRKVLASKESS